MASNILIVYACGAHSLFFALFHAGFWKIFSWKDKLQQLDRINRGIIQVLNLRLIYVFLLCAACCFIFPEELTGTRLGKFLLVGGSLFWIGRTIEQFIFFPFNNVNVHLLTALFLAGAVIFLIAALPLGG